MPASKKKLAVNGAEIKDKSSGDKEIKAEFKKAKDSANKELEIYKNPDIIEACKKEGQEIPSQAVRRYLHKKKKIALQLIPIRLLNA